MTETIWARGEPFPPAAVGSGDAVAALLAALPPVSPPAQGPPWFAFDQGPERTWLKWMQSGRLKCAIVPGAPGAPPVLDASDATLFASAYRMVTPDNHRDLLPYLP